MRALDLARTFLVLGTGEYDSNTHLLVEDCGVHNPHLQDYYLYFPLSKLESLRKSYVNGGITEQTFNKNYDRVGVRVITAIASSESTTFTEVLLKFHGGWQSLLSIFGGGKKQQVATEDEDLDAMLNLIDDVQKESAVSAEVIAVVGEEVKIVDEEKADEEVKSDEAEKTVQPVVEEVEPTETVGDEETVNPVDVKSESHSSFSSAPVKANVAIHTHDYAESSTLETTGVLVVEREDSLVESDVNKGIDAEEPVVEQKDTDLTNVTLSTEQQGEEVASSIADQFAYAESFGKVDQVRSPEISEEPALAEAPVSSVDTGEDTGDVTSSGFVEEEATEKVEEANKQPLPETTVTSLSEEDSPVVPAEITVPVKTMTTVESPTTTQDVAYNSPVRHSSSSESEVEDTTHTFNIENTRLLQDAVSGINGLHEQMGNFTETVARIAASMQGKEFNSAPKLTKEEVSASISIIDRGDPKLIQELLVNTLRRLEYQGERSLVSSFLEEFSYQSEEASRRRG